MHTLDVRLKDIDLFGGKLEFLGDYMFFKGGNYVINGGANPNLVIGDTSGFRVGFIYTHPFGGYTPPPPPPPSLTKEGKPVAAPPPPAGPAIEPGLWQIAAIYGYAAGEMMSVDPNAGQSGNVATFNGLTGVGGGSPFAGYNYNIAHGITQTQPNGDVFVNSGSLRRATRFRGNAQIVWNVTPHFSFGAAAYYEYDDQGSPTAERLSNGDFVSTGGSRNTVGAGIRPVLWLTDWFALQGQAGWDYTSRDRSSSLSTFQPGGPGNLTFVTNDTFGRSGNLGVFTFCPTIKPPGGFNTRPEFRAFVTYAIWSKSLEGSIGSTPYQNNREGWVAGVQAEIGF
jgi:hypothetical protein